MATKKTTSKNAKTTASKKKEDKADHFVGTTAMLTSIGSNKIGVAKVVREFMSCTVAEARQTVEATLPKELKLPAAVKLDEFKAKIAEAGGKLESMSEGASAQAPADAAQKSDAGGADKKDPAPAAPAGGLVAHLYAGPRDVRIPLKEADYVKVLQMQQEVSRTIHETTSKLDAKDEQIGEAEDTLKRRRAERRDLEDIIETAKDRMVEIADANADGFRIERMDVDEIFTSGEIIIKRKGTGEEVGRRNATAAEWEAAQKIKNGDKPVDRWKKGEKLADGKVKLEDGKIVAGDGDLGYIGPEEDPSRPPKKKKGDKDGKKKQREPKTLPASLRDAGKDADKDDDAEDDAE